METQKAYTEEYAQALKEACANSKTIPPVQVKPIPELKLTAEVLAELEAIP